MLCIADHCEIISLQPFRYTLNEWTERAGLHNSWKVDPPGKDIDCDIGKNVNKDDEQTAKHNSEGSHSLWESHDACKRGTFVQKRWICKP